MPHPPAAPEPRRLPDLTPLLGTWRNTDAAAGGVRWLVLADRRGGLCVRALTTGRPEPHDLGEIAACGYAGSPAGGAARAFTGAYDTGVRTMRLAGYVKSGLLVLTTFHAFAGGGGPVPYWLREFFHRHPGPAPPARAVPPDGRATAPSGLWELDPAPLVGVWRNVDPAAGRLSAVTITESGGYLAVRPHGVWTPRRHDWHRTVGSAYADEPCSGLAAAFTAVFDLAVGWVEMAGYLDRRLLTIETATSFADGSGRAPYYVREHFHPS